MPSILAPEPPVAPTPLHLHAFPLHTSQQQQQQYQIQPPPTTPDEDQDRLRLQLALDQIARLDRDFKDFRTRAGAQLAAVVEENRVLRNRLQHYEHDKENLLQPSAKHIDTQRAEPKSLRNPHHKHHPNHPQYHRQQQQQQQQLIKPSERMLCVEEMRKREVLRKSITRRSLRPVRGVLAARDGRVSDEDAKHEYSRDRKDGGGELGAKAVDKSKGRNGGTTGTASMNGRRASLLPRSFSRKWSGCF